MFAEPYCNQNNILIKYERKRTEKMKSGDTFARRRRDHDRSTTSQNINSYTYILVPIVKAAM